MTVARPRRVLFLTSNFPRWKGDTTTPFVLDLARDLQALDWHVEVLAPHAAGAARHQVLDGVPVHRFRYLPVRHETVCYGGGALINLRLDRTNLVKVPALVAAEWAAATRLVRGGRFDVVHAHWILPQGFVATTLPVRAPTLLTVHGGDVFALQGRALAGFKRFALQRAGAVSVNSSATEAAVRALAPDLTTVERIPIGANEAPVDAAEAARIRSRYRRGDGPLLVFVGRLVAEKGVEDLLGALREVAVDAPDATALLLGEGQERARFEKLAVELGVANRVTFTGWVQPHEVPSHLAAADVFVAPSRQGPDGWTEAQGLTIVEAMLAGVPVVATRVGGIGDTVRDEWSGLLVDERAPDQLAAAILTVARDEELAGDLRRRALDFAVTERSRRASAERFAAVLERLAST